MLYRLHASVWVTVARHILRRLRVYYRTAFQRCSLRYLRITFFFSGFGGRREVRGGDGRADGASADGDVRSESWVPVCSPPDALSTGGEHPWFLGRLYMKNQAIKVFRANVLHISNFSSESLVSLGYFVTAFCMSHAVHMSYVICVLCADVGRQQ